jgi:site-specific DNA-cytosine methylase
MWWDRPAPTITTNSGDLSSDTKVHPVEDRVLSLREIRILQTIDSFGHRWSGTDFAQPYWDQPLDRCKDNRFMISDEFFRQIAGEAIPPAFVETLFAHVWRLDRQARASRSS